MVDPWLTLSDLSARGISNAASYAPILERMGLAEQGDDGTWFFSPCSVSRMTKRGRKPRQPARWQIHWIEDRWEGGASVNALRQEMGVHWKVMDRWVRELGLKGANAQRSPYGQEV